ncbi:MAG: flagellar basal-body MS-ring/collar protein FliF [Lautropia sp.]
MSKTSNEIVADAPSPSGFAQVPTGQKIKAGLGVIALGAVAVSAWLWSQQPDWKVLYTSLSDKDGGAVIAQLVQMNVPYQFTEGGGAIMVPANRVHDARLKLAAQGLPRGQAVGFELMENQKFGTTQFQERLNFQRGLEGELARSIQALDSVASARVHLALPAQNGFLREQQKPSASVLLSLHPGRSLDRQQVAGILHLVASSVPEMSTRQVSIVDQNGTLLSDFDSAPNGLDPTQLGYLRQLEASLSRRVIDILEPIVGAGNVRAQVTADLDFTQSEQTAETFKPNQTPQSASIRSQQSLESTERGAGSGAGAGGIPGALSNQPPAAGTAPINGAAQPTQAAAGAAAGSASGTAGAAGGTAAGGDSNVRRETVTNYEIDKTVRVTRNPTGAIRRLSIAVLVNQRQSVNADGQPVSTPLTAPEMESVNALVRDAVGFSKERGDSVNVVNAAFSRVEAPPAEVVPPWKDPANIALAKDLGKQFGFVLLALLILLMFIRPALKAASRPPPAPARRALDASVDEDLELPKPGTPTIAGTPNPNQGMGMTIAQHNALQLARTDPTAVATVVRNWVNGADKAPA